MFEYFTCILILIWIILLILYINWPLEKGNVSLFNIFRYTMCCLRLYNIVIPWWYLQYLTEICKERKIQPCAVVGNKTLCNVISFYCGLRQKRLLVCANGLLCVVSKWIILARRSAADHSPPSQTEMKKACSRISVLPFVLLACSLLELRDNINHAFTKDYFYVFLNNEFLGGSFVDKPLVIQVF